MRNSLDNPFSPGSDAVPEIWAGRTTQLSDWRDVLRPRLARGLPERGRTILGEPGLGKSALVRRIARDASVDGDWVTPQLRIPSGADPLKLVAAALLALAEAAGLPTAREKRIAALLERVQAVAASGLSLTLRGQDGPEAHTALTELLVEVGRAAIAQDVVVLVHLDEVQNIADESGLSQLLIALGDAITHEETVALPGGVQVTRFLPIAVYLTGLPDFEDRAGRQKGATFARRFKTTVLTAIDDDDIVAALQDFVLPGWEVADGAGGTGRIRMEADAVAAIVDLCRGEPFLFQLAGESAWYAGTDATITRRQVLAGWRGVQREAAAHVERILGRLPARERAFLEAMAVLPARDRSLTRIARALGLSKPSEVGTTAQRLDTVRGIIDRGKLYGFRHRAIEASLTSDWPRVD
ncbi:MULTISPECIES: AAA family ATPase [unclassified Rathayibacter]|uniref:AAA family ATPase n=1 Tax=unclassified Rathayibacter TaxID=2609250 RepID=UPI001049C3DA|nr:MULTISPECIES: AAA family ATPase [unclassified Rathayibacter]MCJ1704167.1 ATP-binding protein [Rathayibacter sp. VKM Ac-2926]TCL83179.1 AAA ATPase-like protein [Rathayibacter sp. PhB192]TCM28677.1 AAA ATPase-like protein [Rathayibacter sp. PhB179]